MSRRKSKAIIANADTKQQTAGKAVFTSNRLADYKRIGVVALLVLLPVFVALGAFSEQFKNSVVFGNKAPIKTFTELSAAQSGAPQLSKEYVYAGGRMLAVEDSNINAVPNSISGTVSYGVVPPSQVANNVSGVTINASGASGISTDTNSNGFYLLENLIPGGGYTVAPTKTGSIDHAITSIDATIVLRHLAAAGQGPNALTPTQLLAADANASSTVSAIDATLILRYVAAKGEGEGSFPELGKWKFTPATKSYQPFNSALTNQDYIAIIIGDVNGSRTAATYATAANPVPNQPQMQISLPSNATARTGSEVEIPIMLTNNSGVAIRNYSFQVMVDSSVLELMDINLSGTLTQGCSVTSTGTRTEIGLATTCSMSPGSGTLIKLIFEVMGHPNTSTGSTPLTFRFSETDNRTPLFETNDGLPFAVARINGQFTVTSGAAANSLDDKYLSSRSQLAGEMKTSASQKNKEQLQYEQLFSAQQQQGAVEIALPENAAVPQGGTLLIPVLIRNNSGKRVAGYSFDVRFNPALLQPDGAMFSTEGAMDGGRCQVEANREAAGRIGIAAACPNPKSANAAVGTLVFLRFRVVGQANNANQETRSLRFQQTPVFEDEDGAQIEVRRINGNVR